MSTHEGRSGRRRSAWLAVLLLSTSVLAAGPAQASRGSASRAPTGPVTLAATSGRHAAAAADVAGEAVICIVRGDVSHCWEVDSRTGIYYAGSPPWNWCPGGYVQVGLLFDSNGFWLCAHNELAGKAYWGVGNVVYDTGTLWAVGPGRLEAIWWSSAGWGDCDGSGITEIGRYFSYVGWWLCMGIPPSTTS